MLTFPSSALVGRAVPKTAFYRNLELNARLKQRFVDDVAGITWTAKIAPSTLNVEDGQDVHEIVVFHFVLKAEDIPDDVFLTIDRQMPRHIIFLLQWKDNYRLIVNYKEWHDGTRTQFDIVKTFRTDWKSEDALSLSLEGSTMDKLYEHIAGQISGFGTDTAADTKQVIALQDAIQSKQRKAETLQKKVRTERRFARQMELNTEARALKQEIVQLTEQLNKLTNKNKTS